jgi:hypothetical protein
MEENRLLLVPAPSLFDSFFSSCVVLHLSGTSRALKLPPFPSLYLLTIFIIKLLLSDFCSSNCLFYEDENSLLKASVEANILFFVLRNLLPFESELNFYFYDIFLELLSLLDFWSKMQSSKFWLAMEEALSPC